jgi:hypothetical protein
MAHSEIEVLNKIRASKDPERAMQKAMEILLNHLIQIESCQSQPPVPPAEACEAV